MRLKTAKEQIGKVVSLDLVNGSIITTRIESVDDDGFMKCKHPLVFQVMANPMNPKEGKVANFPYGAPLYKFDEMDVHVDHVVVAFKVSADMEAAYVESTSGIVTPKGPGLIIP